MNMPDSDKDDGNTPPAKSQETTTLPNSDVIFAFGPKKQYFVRCHSKWRYVHPLSPSLDLPVEKLSWAIFLHTNGLLLGGENEAGKGIVSHFWDRNFTIRDAELDSYISARDAYRNLRDWLRKTLDNNSVNVESVSLTIGPNGSYFAKCGTSWISHKLPNDLSKTLNSDIEQRSPAVVALGADNTWIVIWSNGDYTWNLKDNYEALTSSGLLTSKSSAQALVFVALNPYRDNEFFTVTADGRIGYRVWLQSAKEMDALNQMTTDYMRFRSKRDGTKFEQSYIEDGVRQNVTIIKDGYSVESNHMLHLWRQRRAVLARREHFIPILGFAGTSGMTSKLLGATNVNAVRVAASVGFGAALHALYHG